MTEEQKANIYGMLLTEHSRLHNRINEIRSENLDLTKQNQEEIKRLENAQLEIMRKINLLLKK
jgi:uncharacterized membrane protein (DUF106 family)